MPAYEQVLKAAHTFNLLDARGAISVTERVAYIGRIRNLARSVAASYLDSRARLGFPWRLKPGLMKSSNNSITKGCLSMSTANLLVELFVEEPPPRH